MWTAIQAFGIYWITSIFLLFLFTYLYVKLTPYNEVDLMNRGKVGPAIALSGAILGFALPIYSVVVHAGHFQEMVLWTLFSALAQFVAYIVCRTFLGHSENMIHDDQGIPSSIVLGTVSFVLGLLTAACVTP